MPFLLAEILNFQGSTHLIGVGSLSYLLITIIFYFSIALYHIFIFDELSQKILNGIYDRMLYNNKE